MKHLKTKFIVVFLCILAIGCKKQEVVVKNNLTKETKVKDWLDKQQTKEQAQNFAAVEKLKANLEFEKVWDANYVDGKSILLIPIKKEYELINSRGKNPQNFLVLFKNQNNEISSGYIIQYMNEINKFTKNSIPNIYNHVDEELDGTFRILTIHDIYLCEIEYKNNQMKTYQTREAKPKSLSLARSSNCLDWYLTLTDMQTGLTTYTYLYTSCNGCVSNDPNNESIENCDNAGGDVPNDQIVEKNVSWVVAFNPAGSWTLNSSEKLKGIKYGQGPQPPLYLSGKFTEVTHTGDQMVTVQNVCGNLPWATWNKQYIGSGLTNYQQVATVNAIGSVSFCGASSTPLSINEFKIYIFFVEFP